MAFHTSQNEVHHYTVHMQCLLVTNPTYMEASWTLVMIETRVGNKIREEEFIFLHLNMGEETAYPVAGIAVITGDIQELAPLYLG